MNARSSEGSSGVLIQCTIEVCTPFAASTGSTSDIVVKACIKLSILLWSRIWCFSLSLSVQSKYDSREFSQTIFIFLNVKTTEQHDSFLVKQAAVDGIGLIYPGANSRECIRQYHSQSAGQLRRSWTNSECNDNTLPVPPKRSLPQPKYTALI